MLIGHQRVIKLFRESIKHNRVAHAYLFFGPAHLGKRVAALEFIKALNGRKADMANHPDILVIEPEQGQDEEIKKETKISIDQIKKVLHQMNLSPYELKYKAVIIDEAERMTTEASNCLLKTLEEPTGQAILILISSRLESILETIVSRCQVVKFLPVPKKEMEKEFMAPGHSHKAAERIIDLANGRPGLAIEYFKNPALLKERDGLILDLERLIKADLSERYQYVEDLAKDVFRSRMALGHWLVWFRDLLLCQLDCADIATKPEISKFSNFYSLGKIKNIIEQIKKTDIILSSSGFNARLALEVLMLEL